MELEQAIPTSTKVEIKCNDNVTRKFKIVDYAQSSETTAEYYLKPLGKYKNINGLVKFSVKDIYYMLENNSLILIS